MNEITESTDLKFIKFIGKSAISGKLVAAYLSSDGRVTVKAETSGGGPVSFQVRDRKGTFVWRSCAKKILAGLDSLATFEEECESANCHPTLHALRALGYPSI